MIQLPDVIVAKAREVGAEEWVRTIDDLVASVCADWGLTIEHPLDGGTEAFVAAVRRADGSPAVLKLMIPRAAEQGLGARAAELEATVLELAGGDGCAELYERDDGRGALLIERLGPSLFDLDLPLQQRLEIMTDCAVAMWRPASGIDVPTGAEKATWLIDAVTRWWDELDRPCGERTIEHAVQCAERRRSAHHDERAVLVHGDIHQWNTLRTLDGAAHKLVDPDGLLAAPEYDLGILMREDPAEPQELVGRARWLAERTGLDATAIWEWGVIERVSTGLLCRSIGLEPVGTEMLAAADRVSAEAPSL